MRMESGDWERLNAFADGELPDSERRRLEDRIADDPDLQRQLEEIRDLKRKLARMRPPTRQPAPTVPASHAGRFVKGAAIAAGLAVAMVIGASAYFIGQPSPTWVEHAQAIHADASHRAFVVEEGYVQQTVSSGQALEFKAPDLTASRLYLVDITTPRWNDRETIAMHYRGLNGCRLTIVAIEAGDEAPPAAGADNDLLRTWQYGGFLFAAIAEGMDTGRFATAADYARAAIVDTDRRDNEMRTAMAETQRAAQPCA